MLKNVLVNQINLKIQKVKLIIINKILSKNKLIYTQNYRLNIFKGRIEIAKNINKSK